MDKLPYVPMKPANRCRQLMAHQAKGRQIIGSCVLGLGITPGPVMGLYGGPVPTKLADTPGPFEGPLPGPLKCATGHGYAPFAIRCPAILVTPKAQVCQGYGTPQLGSFVSWFAQYMFCKLVVLF